MDALKRGDIFSPEQAMRLAIREAQRGLGGVAPNPAVGCVILDAQGRLVALGHHKKCGGPHAEIEALEQIKDTTVLQSAQVFVTLEPCAHQGRTPSCAKTLARLPIASVVYGVRDPNPLVDGQGAEILRAAGIKVELYSGLQEELHEVCEVFLHNQRKHLPFVALKVATTLDGHMALQSGEPLWLTSQPAIEHVHELRGQYDAILVGRGTLEKDNPQLNVRYGLRAGKELKVVVLDPRGQALEKFHGSRLAQVHKPENVYWVIGRETSRDGAASTGVQLIKCARTADGFALSELLQELYRLGVGSVFVEGGQAVYASFLNAGLVQRIYQYTAPKQIAENGVRWLQDVSASVSMRAVRKQNLGPDIFVTGLVTRN